MWILVYILTELETLVNFNTTVKLSHVALSHVSEYLQWPSSLKAFKLAKILTVFILQLVCV